MREKTPATAASRRPDASREYGDDGLFQRVVLRMRDLLIMGVVGPVTGVLAIVAIHFATALQPAVPQLDAQTAKQREADRVMAILEDRAVPMTASIEPSWRGLAGADTEYICAPQLPQATKRRES